MAPGAIATISTVQCRVLCGRLCAGGRPGRSYRAGRRLPIPRCVSRSDRLPNDHLSLADAARFVALWRLAAGAAHATNNCLTAILGEASYLRDECKADARVVACCDAIMTEVDRCARLTRALLSQRQPAQSGDEVDLGRLLGAVGEILPDALGRRYDLHLEPGEQLRVVSAAPAELELLVLCLVQSACGLAGDTARLELSAEAGTRADHASLRLVVEGPGLPGDAAVHMRDPDPGTDAALRTLLLAARELAGNLGSRLEYASTSGWLEARVELRLAPGF